MLPVIDPRTTSGRPPATAKSTMISSGAFPKLAFRNPPIPGAGVLGRVLGRLADQPGERHERCGRDAEDDDVVGVDAEAKERCQRGERKSRKEDPARHGLTLSGHCRLGVRGISPGPIAPPTAACQVLRGREPLPTIHS